MFRNIPPELKKYPQWVGWIGDKRPVNPKHEKPYYASSTNADTWGSYNQAITAYRRFDLDGIGFVFTEEDPFVGIDLDKFRNIEKETYDYKAAIIVQSLNSYTEISTSNSGLHIIVRAKLPYWGKQSKEGDKGEKIEIYSHGRYFIMTGKHIEETPKTIENRDVEITKLIKKYLIEYKNPLGMKSVWDHFE